MNDPQKGERRIAIRLPLNALDVIRKLARRRERSFNGDVICGPCVRMPNGIRMSASRA